MNALNDSHRCPNCGALLAADGPAGNCPNCLFALAAALAPKLSAPSPATSETGPDVSQLSSAEGRMPDPTTEGEEVGRTRTVRHYFGDYGLLEELHHGSRGNG